MNKKNVSVVSAAFLACAALPLMVSAETEESVNVTVNISSLGSLVVANEPITVSDADQDGSLTINDALILAHDKFYEGGSGAGYESASSDWGLSLKKLWGEQNGGSFGYTLNNAFVMTSLAEPITEGDVVYAYSYEDTTSWSDMASFFSDNSVENVKAGDSFTLTLYALGYDENFSPVQMAVEGADILINGAATDLTTDADGKVTIQAAEEGDMIISAAHRSMILVPPVCKVSVAAAETTTTTGQPATTAPAATTANNATTKPAASSAPKTGDTNAIPALAIAGVLAACTAFMMRRNND